MNQEEKKFRLLLENLPGAFAYHQVVTDNEGAPVDYIFLEINEAFEEMTGLKRDKVIGKKVTEVLPGIDKSEFDWIGIYGNVALSGKPARFENYFEQLGRWYDVSVQSDESGYFAVTFRDISFQKNEMLNLEKLIALVEKNLQSPIGEINYKDLTDGLLELSGAKFVATNTYDLSSNKSVTRAISGIAAGIRKAGSMLGINLVDKAWDIIPERLNAIKEGRLLRFANLYDSASGTIPKKVSTLMEKTFGIGEVYVAEVAHEGKTIGDLIMFMPRDKILEHPKLIELYAAQIGIMLVRKEITEALQESEMRNKAMVKAIPDLLFRFNREGVYLDVDVKDEVMLHPNTRALFRQNKLIGKTMVEMLPAPIADKLITGIKKALASGEIQIFEYNYSAKNSEHYFEARLAPIGTTEVVSIVRDITERKRHEDKLQYISFHDQLTGLYNRRYYENELKRLDNSREHPIAVISADLDGLKLINDTQGHNEGDKYLKTGAKLLKGALRTSDILARVGGDEFAVVLPGTTLEVGQKMVERMHHQIEEYNRQKTTGPSLSISIGLAVSESGEHRLEKTFKKADEVMYEAKKQRRENQHRYTPTPY